MAGRGGGRDAWGAGKGLRQRRAFVELILLEENAISVLVGLLLPLVLGWPCRRDGMGLSQAGKGATLSQAMHRQAAQSGVAWSRGSSPGERAQSEKFGWKCLQTALGSQALWVPFISVTSETPQVLRPGTKQRQHMWAWKRISPVVRTPVGRNSFLEGSLISAASYSNEIFPGEAQAGSPRWTGAPAPAAAVVGAAAPSPLGPCRSASGAQLLSGPWELSGPRKLPR